MQLVLVELSSASLVSAILHARSLLIGHSCIAAAPTTASTASMASAGGLEEPLLLLLLHPLLRVGGRRLPLLHGGRRVPVHVPSHVHVMRIPQLL